MFRQWVRFPMTPVARHLAKEIFTSARNPFKGALGAIDCTHVAILAPRMHEKAYVNHHGYHSLNVQMICDPNLKILNVNARYPGARHDSYIWNSCAARQVMMRSYNNGERRTFLIGNKLMFIYVRIKCDSGYPLEPWLMTPLPHQQEETPQYRYNFALCSARNCVERLFGVLKSTWRCLSRHRTLQYEPGFSGRIVNACSVLHNMRASEGLLEDPVEELFEPEINRNPPVNILQPLAVAKRIQSRIIEEKFSR